MTDLVRAAGVMFQAADGAVLLMRRTDTGEWSFPGGHIEGDETTLEAAAREALEETGRETADLREHTRRIRDGVDFTTFLVKVEDRFDPTLDHEHDAWRWALPEDIIKSDPARMVETPAPPVAPDQAILPEPPASMDSFHAKLDAALARLDAAGKITMQAAGYVEDGHGDERCENCTMFRAPDSCTLVEGDVRPEGWCRHFEASRDARLDAALARLDEFKESEHPRGEGGKFSSGGSHQYRMHEFSANQLDREIEKAGKRSSSAGTALINAGRGSEKFSESVEKAKVGDPLAKERMTSTREESALREHRELRRTHGEKWVRQQGRKKYEEMI